VEELGAGRFAEQTVFGVGEGLAIEEPNDRELDFGSFMLSRVRDILGGHDHFRHP
jgi:hypothetical protein